MPVLPGSLRRRRALNPMMEQRAQEERGMRQMEKYYREHEEVMSPERAEDDRVNPARKDYRMMQRLRRRGR